MEGFVPLQCQKHYTGPTLILDGSGIELVLKTLTGQHRNKKIIFMDLLYGASKLETSFLMELLRRTIKLSLTETKRARSRKKTTRLV